MEHRLLTNDVEYSYCDITTPFNFNTDIRTTQYTNTTTLSFDIRQIKEYANTGYYDYGDITFKEDGVYLVELIYVPLKINDAENYHSPYYYSKRHSFRFVANNGKQYIEPLGIVDLTAKQYSNGIYDPGTRALYNGVSGGLCLFEVKNGVLTRITNDEITTNIPLNINIKVGKDFEIIDNVFFKFGKIESKEKANFNSYWDLNKLAGIDDVFSVVDNKMRLIYHKYCYWYNGWYGYNDWCYIRIAGLGIYKLRG